MLTSTFPQLYERLNVVLKNGGYSLLVIHPVSCPDTWIVSRNKALSIDFKPWRGTVGSLCVGDFGL